MDRERVSSDTDSFEQNADCAAQNVISGRPAGITASGTPPGIQRQPAQPKLVNAAHEEVERELTAFLERVQQVYPRRSLLTIDVVQTALLMLAQGCIPE